jgi:hypothetical protein
MERIGHLHFWLVINQMSFFVCIFVCSVDYRTCRVSNYLMLMAVDRRYWCEPVGIAGAGSYFESGARRIWSTSATSLCTWVTWLFDLREKKFV